MTIAFFTDAIQAQIDADRDPYNRTSLPHHTVGQFIRAVLAIDDPVQAVEFSLGCVEWLMETFGQTREHALGVARSNIGWSFGEGMAPDKMAMWRAVTGAEHPAGRIEEMTPQEILDAGKRWAEQRPRDEL